MAMTRAITKAAFQKNTFDKKTTGVMTRAMTTAAFEGRKTEKRVVYKGTKKTGGKDDNYLMEEKRKNVKKSTITDFVNSRDLDSCVTAVPGIGKVHEDILDDKDINTVSDLLDIFFEMEDKEGEGAYNQFEQWLKSIGINSYRETISMCISAKWFSLVVNVPVKKVRFAVKKE